MITSNRQTDINGFVEIKNNPISKVGVFPYSGRSIDESLPPDEIFYVFRPPEELADPECIDSFKLQPFIDEHTFLGEGHTPVEEKGVPGVLGENISFDGEFLRGNLKIFSNRLLKLIQDGKKEVSLGYRCKYEPQKGTYKGQAYDFIQRQLRGNHGALVQNGRCGSSVAVLDKLTFDEAEFSKMIEQTQLDALNAKVDTLTKAFDDLKDILAANKATLAKDADEDKEKDEDKEAKDMDEDKEKEEDKKAKDADEDKEKDEDKDAKDEDEDKEKDKEAKDSRAFDEAEFKKEIIKEFNAKNKLADHLSWVVGTFDHADLTLDEVAHYGLRKLGLTAPKGAETAVLNAYLAAKQGASARVTADTKETGGSVLSTLLQQFK